MKRIGIAMAFVVVLFGCNSEKKNESADVTAANALDKSLTSDSTSAQKIIKTADMRFRVKNVQHTKEQLSAILKAQGGTVAEFSMQSTIRENDKIKQSTDSLKEITAYQTEGYLIAKIPSEKLDDFTNTVAGMAVFVNSQALKMDDQSLSYLSNTLKAQNRIENAGKVDRISNQKISTTSASLSLKDDVVDRKIANIDINNRVKYSTITLNFYQDDTIQTRIIANDNLYDYRPAFANRLWLNVIGSWTIFQEIILFLANLWTLVLAAIAMYFGIRYYKMKRVKVAS